MALVTGTTGGQSGRWRGRGLWLAVALLVCLPFLFYWRLFTPDLVDRGSFPAGDFGATQYAPTLYLAERLAAGDLPLWCAGGYGGFPFVGDIQNGVFYLPRLLAVLLASPWGFPYLAMELEAVAHFSLAGVFLFLFGRRLFGQDGAAYLMATTFTFGAYLTGYPVLQLAILHSAVWLPLALLCTDHAVTEESALNRWTLALAATLAMCVLGGHPQTAMHVYYLVAVYGLWRGRKRATVAVIALAMGLSVGLTAGQLLPTVEYTLLSSRGDLGYDAVSSGLPLREVVQVLLPGITSIYSPLYVGILPLMLVAAGLLRPRRACRFWLAVLIVSFMLALGNQVFLHRLFYLLAPGWSLFRGQERLAFIVSFAACVLTGYGAEAVLAGAWTVALRQQLLRYVGRFLWLLVALVVVTFLGLVAQGWTAASTFYWAMAVAVYVLIVGTLGWALLRWRLLGGASGRRFVLLAAALLLFDLFSVGWRQNFSSALPETHEEVPPAVQAVKDAAAEDDRPYRVYNEGRLPGSFGVQFGVEDVGGSSPLRLARQDQVASALPRSRLWSLFAVRYVLTWEESLSEPTELVATLLGTNGETTYVHRLTEPAPYAWLVHAVEQASREEVLGRLADGSFDPSTTALTEEPLAVALAPASAEESVSVTARSPERVVLSVDASADALLVVSEVYYPGWQVTVDGVPTRAIVADYVLRGVPVSAGEHVVEMAYRPTTWYVGCCISLISLLAVLVGLALARWRRPSPGSSGAASA